MIGQILNTEPLTGKNATKDQVLSRFNSVSLVHIAAHGRQETGEIILSPNISGSKRPKEENFLLTRADVLNAKLHAKLVVLSCCNSGEGRSTQRAWLELHVPFWEPVRVLLLLHCGQLTTRPLWRL